MTCEDLESMTKSTPYEKATIAQKSAFLLHCRECHECSGKFRTMGIASISKLTESQLLAKAAIIQADMVEIRSDPESGLT